VASREKTQQLLLGPLTNNGGPTFTHALLVGSPAVNAGDPTAVGGVGNVPTFDQRGSGFDRVLQGRIDIGAFESDLLPPIVDGDFNDDGLYDCLDIDALVAEIAAGTDNTSFDLSGDGLVDVVDRDMWLAEAGAVNLGPGKIYLLGDANLDGFVDGLDFIQWNANKFTSVAEWCAGDFNADGFVDGLDFIIWNANKFQSSDVANALVLPKSSRNPHVIHESRDIRLDENTSAAATSPVTRLLTAERVDSVFATPRRGEDHKDERPKADSFENFCDALPTPRPLIVS
jgi:hypothetical protein